MYKREGIATKIPEKPEKAPKGSLPGPLPLSQKRFAFLGISLVR